VKVVWPPTVNLAKDMRELKRGEIETAAAVPGTFSAEEK
jgi:hypothetical protein